MLVVNVQCTEVYLLISYTLVMFQEEYEDPDQTVAMTGPPIPPGARRPLPPPIASVPRSHIVVPEEPSV